MNAKSVSVEDVMPANWVDAEADPKDAAAKARQVTDDEWTRFDSFFYHACCDCGLAHRADVRKAQGGFEVRWQRMETYTAELRKQRDFPLKGGQPCDDQDDQDERDDSPYCDCGSFPGEEEEAFNRCSACGKRLDP